jgi:YVTN family beta-propeller protein
VAVTPDGATVLAGNSSDANVSFINAADGTVIDTLAVGDSPAGVAIAPNGATAYVANGGGQSVSVIDIASRAVVDTISVGEAPRGVVLTPDGASLFVTNVLGPPGPDNAGTVSVIDTAAGEVSGEPIPVGNGPVAIAVSDDGSELYVANLMGNTVSVINVANRAVERIAGLNAPFDLTFGPCPPPDANCVGDCDNSGAVGISELITGVNISLGSRPLSACPAFDSDNTQQVSIAELIRAVNNALDGCPS